MSSAQINTRPSMIVHAMCVVAVVLVAWVQPTSAATLRVAQDGTGDYTSLFDALAAAQDGDIVSIAPGEYTATRWINPAGIAFEVIGYLTASDVSIVGDDRETVIVGPTVAPPGLLGDGVHGVVVGNGAEGVNIRGLTFRNLSVGLRDADQAIVVEACSFVGNYYGLEQAGLGSCTVRQSHFTQNRYGLIAYAAYGVRRLEIVDCTFADNLQAMQIQNGDTLVSGSRIDRGEVGVLLTLGGNAVIQECEISETENRGVHVQDGSTAWLYNNVFQGAMQYNVFNSGALVGGGNLLSGGSTTTLMLAAPGVVEFYGNHLLNAGGRTVEALIAPWTPRTISLANNWWGTTDPAQIEEWVEHAPDDPENNGLTIEYLPLYGGPVPNKPSSVGRLKATFSDH